MENSIRIVEEHDALRGALRAWAARVLPRYRVIEAASDEEGLTLARNHRPGVVFADMGWFARDRIQTIRRIKGTVDHRHRCVDLSRPRNSSRARGTSANLRSRRR